jgi:ferrous iron transport protein B
MANWVRMKPLAAGVEVEADGFDFFGSIGEAFATIPANLAALGGTLLDPLGLSVGDVSDLETAAEEQAVAYTTFGQMALRFDGRVGAFAYLLFVLDVLPLRRRHGCRLPRNQRRLDRLCRLLDYGLGLLESAVMFYQVMMFQNHPASSTAWIVGLIAIAIVTLLIMRYSRPARKRRALLIEGQ